MHNPVDGTTRFTGRFGNLFMSRASIMSTATGNDGYTSRYFSVTNTRPPENGYTAGHNAYFDYPLQRFCTVSITGDTTWVAFYNIFYEVGRRHNSRYSEFYAVTADSIPTDASVNDTLLALNNAGRGIYWSLYYWMLSDSVRENNRAYRGKGFLLRTRREERAPFHGNRRLLRLLLQLAECGGIGVETSDFHGSPTFGKLPDRKYLDAFYRIHELDRIPFENNFIFYWESWDGWPKILQSRYCHIGYTIIYYLEHRQPG